MKYKAIALSFLLLLPLLITGASAGFPNQPPTHQPVLWVDMGGGKFDKKVYGPCHVSEFFDVNVRLYNVIEVTGDEVYAFDFSLTWNAAGSGYPNDPHINLTNLAYHLPANWFLIDETPLTTPMNTIHFAATAMAAADALTNAVNMSLVTLTFHIEDEPCYGYILHENHFFTPFTLANIGMSGDGDEPIVLTPEIDSGSYRIEAWPNDIHLSSPDMLYDESTGLYYIYERALGVKHTIQVILTNVTHAFAYYVSVRWDENYKMTNVQTIDIGPDWILTNYEYEDINLGSGYLCITLVRPITKGLIHGTSSVAFEFDLTVISPDYGHLPHPENTTIWIEEAWVLEDPIESTIYQYNYEFVGMNPLLQAYYEDDSMYYSCDLINWWDPKKADLNLDGKVSIKDLQELFDFYGETCDWGCLADPVGTTGVVDVFDFVYVAKKIGDC